MTHQRVFAPHETGNSSHPHQIVPDHGSGLASGSGWHSAHDVCLVFGPFTLNPAKRQFMRGGEQVPIGSRALDILITLAESAGDVVTKTELTRKVWPNIIVEESTLRVHIANLRRLLGDGQDDARYIINVTGRGYCFVGSVLRTPKNSEPVFHQTTNLLSLVADTSCDLVGREKEIDDVTTLLGQHRFVCLTGPHGVGKSVLAEAIADLSILAQDRVLTIQVSAESWLHRLNEKLSDWLDGSGGVQVGGNAQKAALLVLDGCDRSHAAVADFSGHVMKNFPQVAILATSQRCIEVRKGCTFKVKPLATPPDDPLSIDQLFAFPSTRLFLRQLARHGARAVHATEASMVSQLCRALEGLPLAIEIAAARVAVLGLKETTRLAETTQLIGWKHQNVTGGGQRSLSDGLGEAFARLDVESQRVLACLSLWIGSFSLADALAVAHLTDGSQATVLNAIEALAATSFVDVEERTPVRTYRIPSVARTYIVERSSSEEYWADACCQHARACLQRVRSAGPGSAIDTSSTAATETFANIRFALAWAAGSRENSLAAQLAEAAIPLFLRHGRHEEWVDRTDTILGTAGGAPDPVIESRLRAARAYIMFATSGFSEELEQDLELALAMAENTGQLQLQIQILRLMHQLYQNVSSAAEQVAVSDLALLLTGVDSGSRPAVWTMVGTCQVNAGNLLRARRSLTSPTVLLSRKEAAWSFPALDGHLQLARTLWLQAEHQRAVDLIQREIRELPEDPPGACRTLGLAIELLLLAQNDDEAATEIERLTTTAARYGLRPYAALAAGFLARLRLRCGEVEFGLRRIGSSLHELKSYRFLLHLPTLCLAVCDGLSKRGFFDQALGLVDEQLSLVSEFGAWLAPELFRTRGDICILAGDAVGAQQDFVKSESLAQKQGAVTWFLRTSVSHAGLLQSLGQRDAASALLWQALSKVPSGPESVDTVRAKQLLACLA